MTRPRRLRARLLLSLAAACVAAYAFAGHAAASESRAARALDFPEGRSAPFAVLLQPDVVRYRQNLRAAARRTVRPGRQARRRAGRSRPARPRPGGALPAPPLPLRFRRAGRLAQPLRGPAAGGPPLPPRQRPDAAAAQAPAGPARRLAQGRRAGAARGVLQRRLPAPHGRRPGRLAEGRLRDGRGPLRRAGRRTRRSRPRSWRPPPSGPPRAQLRAKHPEGVAPMLRRAARASDGFYGLLAQRLLDETISFDWRREEFRDEMAGLLRALPHGQARHRAGPGRRDGPRRGRGAQAGAPRRDRQHPGADRARGRPRAALRPDAPRPAAPPRRRPAARRRHVPDPTLGAADRLPARPDAGLRRHPRRERLRHRGGQPAGCPRA